MNYYIDTEFLEGTQKEIFPISLFRKHTPPTIDLISIGIVAEDGREYYAILKDFNLEEAWNRFDLKLHSGDRRNQGNGTYKEYWIRENVLNPIFMDLQNIERGYLEKQRRIIGYAPCIDAEFCFSNFKRLLKKFGKTNKQITEEIKLFVVGDYNHPDLAGKSFYQAVSAKNNPPKFYAYYADYDWVAFCWLFGKMIDLPNGFPMYCRDLKQDYDFFNANFIERKKRNAVGNIHKSINELKDYKDYPKQENEHNALDDARWNKKLHEFLIKL